MTSNAGSRFYYRVRRQTAKQDSERNQPVIFSRPAFIGDASGNVTTFLGDTLDPGYIVVRDFKGNLSVVFNQRVPPVANTPVYVGYDYLEPNLYQVLSTRGYFPTQNVLSIPAHAATHEWPGYDAVYVSRQQILPALVTVKAGMVVAVYPFVVRLQNGTSKYIDYSEIDLTSHIPAAGTGARWTLVCADQTTGTITLQDGPLTLVGLSALMTTPIPAANANTVPIAAVAMYDGMTEVIETATQDTILDMRGWVPGSTVSSTLSYYAGTLLADGVSNPGVAASPARGDHVHPEKYGTNTPIHDTQLGTPGVSANLSREDHSHPFETDTVHIHRVFSWTTDGAATNYDLPDIAEYLEWTSDNGAIQDPLTAALSNDGQQIVFSVAPLVGHTIVAEYVATIA